MAENTHSNLIITEKLSGRDNFNNWKFAVKMALIHENLWRCIDGYTADDSSTVNERLRLDQRALAKICLMVQPVAYPYVRTAKTAKEAWDNLCKTYEDKGLSRRLTLIRNLVRVKLENHSSMENYVDETMAIAQKLADIGHGVDDEFLGVILLSGLTSEYDPMVMAIENSGTKITSDLIKSKLLQDDTFGKDKSESALLSRRKQYKSGKKNFKCFNCGMVGHFKGNCPKIKHKSKTHEALCASTNVSPGNREWYVDSGATTHMSCHQDWFSGFKEQSGIQVTVANNQTINSCGVGEIELETRNGTKVISDVVLVPELKANLLSVNKMIKKGHAVTFTSSGCTVYKQNGFSVDGEIVVTASEDNGLYKLDVMKEKTYFTVDHGDLEQLWHRRLGHLNKVSMNLLKNGMANGISFPTTKTRQCVVCALGKHSRQPFTSNANRAEQKLELIHSDICGPMPRKSWGGARYLLTFIDDYTRKIFVYFLKSKSEVYERFKEFQVMVENQTDCRIKKLRSDNGTEYLSTKFQQYLKEKGIIHQTTIAYSPEQNGVAERTNRSIVEKARCLMQDAKCEEEMWAEAVNTAVYLKNRSPHRTLKAIPEELWTNRKVDLRHLKVFGCIVQAHIPHQQRRKFDPKSQMYMFVGYCEDSKGYRLFDLQFPGKIIKSRDVIFFENEFKSINANGKRDVEANNVFSSFITEGDDSEPIVEEEITPETTQEVCVNLKSNEECVESEVESVQDDSGSEEEFSEAQSDIKNTQRESVLNHSSTNVNESVRAINNISATPTAVRRSTREAKPKQFPDYISYCAVINQSIPSTVQEALNSGERNYWKEAMDDEYKALMENNAWVLVNKPNSQKIVQCKWVFTVKDDVTGKKRYKARLVAKGFTQQFGVDYNETFSPVVRNSTLKLLFALSVMLNLSIDHVDVSTAFLNGELTENIYMYQPEGFVYDNNKVCLLKKAIYGLKQASRVWNKKVESILLKAGYKQSKFESCVYIKCVDKCIMFVAVYVDDFLIFSNDENEKCNLKKLLSDNFKVKDLGKAKRCLGLNITNDCENGIVKIDQKHYIDELVSKFGLNESKSVTTPIEAGLKLDRADKCDVSIPYQCLIGSLMFLAVNTRPDIAYAVSYLSQFNTCYADVHYKHAKRVLKYLKGTSDYGLVFRKQSVDVMNICAYADADWANDHIDRKSYTGYVFKLAGSAISWEAKKQQSVSLSSTEAEYVSITQASKEAVYLKNLLNELTNVNSVIQLYNDNQSAQKLVYNPVFHNRTKHIDVKYHYIRELVEQEIVKLCYLPTEKMIADIMTKGLHAAKHKFCFENLGLEQKGC